jgi:hypothetical protein
MNDSIPVPAPAVDRRTLVVKICELLCVVADDEFYGIAEMALGFDDDDLEIFRDRTPGLAVHESICRLVSRTDEGKSP